MTKPSVLFCLWVLLFSSVRESCADEISVVQVSGHAAGEFYFVDATVQIELSADARNAVESGVPLQFVFDFEVHRPRRFMWDRKLLVLRRSGRLERHALANKFVVTDLVTHQRAVHTSIEDAMAALGELNDITLGKAKDLLGQTGLQGRLRAQLDIEALPAPLRPIAYLSPSWHLKSAWQEWSLSP